MKNIESADFFSALFILVLVFGALFSGVYAECNLYAAFYRYRTTGVDKKSLKKAIIFTVAMVVFIPLAFLAINLRNRTA